MEEIKKMSIKFPNDREFGTNVRPVVKSTEEFGSIERSNPNDMDLGKKIREILNK